MGLFYKYGSGCVVTHKYSSTKQPYNLKSSHYSLFLSFFTKMPRRCFIHRHHQEDDLSFPLDSLPYSSHNFDLYASDPEYPPSDRSFPLHIARNHLSTRGTTDPEYDTISDPYLFGPRENQVNFVMDLFQQRIERSQVMGDSDLMSEALSGSGFGVIEGNEEIAIDNFDMDIGLGFGSESNSNFGLVVECCDDDGFFVERRGSGSESGEASSTVSRVETFANSVRIEGFGSDSEEGESEELRIDLHMEDEYGLEHVDEDASFPLCWDSLRLEDPRETNEDFEWEEVDGRLEERDFLSMFMDADDEGSVSYSVSPLIAPEVEASAERVGGLGNLEWEVLLNVDNMERNLDMGQDGDPYFGDHDDYIYTAEYEMLFGQFAESENTVMGQPPASQSVVQNLLSVVMTSEAVANNNAICAVCKDEMNVGEKAKQLPCSHHYHGDCILPWLGIRNTCPVCRYELPTDDADYERRKIQRAGHGV